MSERKPIGLTFPYRSVFPKKDYKLPKEWVGLTDEEYQDLHLQMGADYFYQDYGKSIEAKLKEKNHG